jgi:hypothetical protein
MILRTTSIIDNDYVVMIDFPPYSDELANEIRWFMDHCVMTLLTMATVRSAGQGWGKEEAVGVGGASALHMADDGKKEERWGGIIVPAPL